MTKIVDFSKSICGIHLGTHLDVLRLMPELEEIMMTFPAELENFVWDVKIHQLMPRQFPCIPNWHSDFVPRGANLLEQWDRVDPSAPMYLWVSGDPLPEFFDCRPVTPRTWIRFNQLDTHRGTPSRTHTWRCFIRAAHCSLVNPNDISKVKRVHSQVYLDVDNFKW